MGAGRCISVHQGGATTKHRPTVLDRYFRFPPQRTHSPEAGECGATAREGRHTLEKTHDIKGTKRTNRPRTAFGRNRVFCDSNPPQRKGSKATRNWPGWARFLPPITVK